MSTRKYRRNRKNIRWGDCLAVGHCWERKKKKEKKKEKKKKRTRAVVCEDSVVIIFCSATDGIGSRTEVSQTPSFWELKE